jgi:parallel beta-helix repeat protein
LLRSIRAALCGPDKEDPVQALLTRRRAALAATLLAVPAVALGATRSQAGTTRPAAPKLPLDTVVCGQSITKSMKLANDLPGCQGNGLAITASKVTLDLNGHKIAGDAGAIGVDVVPGTTGSAVLNGDISGFSIGVDVAGTSTRVQNVRAHDNPGSAGILLEADRDVLTGSTIYSNGGDGVVASGTRIQVVNSTIRANAGRGIGVGSAEPDMLGAVISGNKVLSNDTDGIFVQTDGVTISGNTVDANDGHGIVTTSKGITVTKNTTLSNTRLGINADPGGGDGGGNHAVGNGMAHQCENVVCS